MIKLGTMDALAMVIASMDRQKVREKLKNFHGRFKLDFTDEYLESLSVDRLRHILFAAVVTKHKRRSHNL